MPRISVKNDQVREFRTNDGKIIRSQMACLDLGDGYELPFRVGIGSRPPYSVGFYDLDPAKFRPLGEFGDLTLSQYVDLVPVKTPRAAAAKA
ncbi:MAG: single-stranded DNA-binding protein [Lysobacteraceae bacterium]